MRAPVLNAHSFFPVLASSANASPSRSPPKIKSPAVASSDDWFTYFVGNVHCFFPVSGSNALIEGGAFGFSIRPARKFVPGVKWLHISEDDVYHHPVRGL